MGKDDQPDIFAGQHRFGQEVNDNKNEEQRWCIHFNIGAVKPHTE